MEDDNITLKELRELFKKYDRAYDRLDKLEDAVRGKHTEFCQLLNELIKYKLDSTAKIYTNVEDDYRTILVDKKVGARYKYDTWAVCPTPVWIALEILGFNKYAKMCKETLEQLSVERPCSWLDMARYILEGEKTYREIKQIYENTLKEQQRLETLIARIDESMGIVKKENAKVFL